MNIIERVVEIWYDILGEHQHRWEFVYPSSPTSGLRCRCGKEIRSDPGPHGFTMAKADGPHCGWDSEAARRRQEAAADREVEAAKWRTLSGHDICLVDEHWSRVHMNHGWPSTRVGDEPVDIWACRHCGYEIREQTASSFTFVPGVGAIGYQDRFNLPGAFEREVERTFSWKMAHLSTHGIDTALIVQATMERQNELQALTFNHSCQLSPGGSMPVWQTQ